MESIVDKVEGVSRGQKGSRGLAAIIEAYLSLEHRDNRAEGCPLAAVGSELACADEERRAAVSEGLQEFKDVIARQLAHRSPEAARSDALFVLSAMVGALTLSRIVTDPDLSEAILSDAKQHLFSI
jgi:TetR/AcrR family transcriptional repressor of nem operon